MSSFGQFFLHSNVNFPEGQLTSYNNIPVTGVLSLSDCRKSSGRHPWLTEVDERVEGSCACVHQPRCAVTIHEAGEVSPRPGELTHRGFFSTSIDVRFGPKVGQMDSNWDKS